MTESERRKRNVVAVKRYWCSPRGFLCRTYSLMLRRVRSADGYQGLPILSRDEFYRQFEYDGEFLRLFYPWRERIGKRMNFRRALASRPVPDRINSACGYVLGNIRWLTYSENSARR